MVFKDLLLRLLSDEAVGAPGRFATQQELAAALGVQPSTISRVLKSNDVLGFEGCLRLAKIAPYSYRHVFELAGKPEIAALIHDVKGPRATLTVEERTLLAHWGQLPPATRAVLLRLLTLYLTPP